MTEKQQQILSDTYKNYLNGDNSKSYLFYTLSDEEHLQLLTDLDYLKGKNFIEFLANALGFADIKLTSTGIDFVENGFQELSNSPIITQGNNSIYIQGSGNTVSDNYNQIVIDINNSDLPSEYKELISTLLYELKNPNLPTEKKTGKIKQFISEITSNTLSDTASAGLTLLLNSLFSQIQF